MCYESQQKGTKMNAHIPRTGNELLSLPSLGL